MNCQTCTNPTKHFIGMWDGENGTSGYIFDCENISCEIKKKNCEMAMSQKKIIDKVIQKNTSNGISMLKIKMQRKSLEITLTKMARELGISPSKYSNYETCREPLPVELRDRIEGVFKEQKGGYMGEILRKYGRNK